MERRDEVIDRIATMLRPLPDVDAEAKARVLIAVAAEREREREARTVRQRWSRRIRWTSGGALVAAALLAAVYLRNEPMTRQPVPEQVATTSNTQPAAQLVGGDAAALEVAAQPVQFVFRAPNAGSVRVVGDFNGWDKEQAPMVRDSASGLWSATLMVRPGRHVYAFLVDDSVWTRDPRAPQAPDQDFGRPGSLLLVTRPSAPGAR